MEFDSLNKSLSEIFDLIKGRAALPTGTIREWSGGKYQKQADGKWLPITDDKATKKEEKKDDKGNGKEDSSKDSPTNVKVNGKDFKILSEVDLSKSPKTAAYADKAYHVEDSKGTKTYLMKTKEGHWEIMDGFQRKKVGVEGLDDKPKEEAKPETKEPEKPKQTKEQKEIIKTAEKVAKEAGKEPKDTSELKDSPRKEAKEETERMKKEEYAFARESDFSNLGEDLWGSARHKRNMWKGLKEAEADGTAESLINRDMLAKNEPLDLIAHVNKKNFLTALAVNAALKRFPSEAPKAWFKGTFNRVGKQITEEEYNVLMRKDYYESYMKIKEKAEELVKTDTDVFKAVEDLRTLTNSIIGELRRRDGAVYNQVAEKLIPFHNTVLTSSRFRMNKKSALMDINDFAKASLAAGYISKEENDKLDLNKLVSDNALEAAKAILEGKSMNKAFGMTGTRDKGFNPADLYINNVAERVGPEIEVRTQKQQEKFLVDKLKMRGVQWGNSVTDEEREHHLKMSAEAFKDLTEILDLPEEMASFNGRLGLAIGARGKGMALAHYEPDSKVINLTRKGGVGSLAHEWGHFFDNTLEQLASNVPKFGGHTSYFSESAANLSYYPGLKKHYEEIGMGPIAHAYGGLSSVMSDVKMRIRKDGHLDNMSDAKKSYWLSTREVFARSFETYIMRKLEKMGRKNTYLSGVASHGLWPTNEEVDKMTPYFDQIFDSFKKSDYLTKSFMKIVYNKG